MTAVRYSFVYQGGFLSWAIARFGATRDGFSHVDCVMPDGSLIGARSDTITPPGGEPIQPGFRKRPDNYEKWVRRDVVEIQVSEFQAAQRNGWIAKHLNAPYDMAAIMGFILGRPEHDRGEYICSAAATASAVTGSLIHKPPIPYPQVTPNDFWLMLYAVGGRSVLRYGW